MENFSLGQRYIAAGTGEGAYELRQVPGNALGAYLDGARIEAFCNVQDATGDTMTTGRSSSTAPAGTPPATPCGAGPSLSKRTRATAVAST